MKVITERKLSTSEKLEIIIRNKGYTKKEIAEKIGTSQQNLSKKFKFNDWRESDIKEICDILDVELEIRFNFHDGTHI